RLKPALCPIVFDCRHFPKSDHPLGTSFMLPSILLDIEVDLEFTCDSCARPVGATAKCAGKTMGPDVSEAVAVKIPCPNCHTTNHVLFTPEDGSVLHVVADKTRYMIPVPSLN